MTEAQFVSLEEAERRERFRQHGAETSDSFEGAFGERIRWNNPKPLPSDLLPVAAFDLDLLPTSIRPWVADIADRMQCPSDFLGVSAMVALSAVVGRKIGVRPQARTDWLEVPNLWGCIIARPGAMKSPAMSQTLAQLHRLEAKARETNQVSRAAYDIALETFKLQKDEAGKKARGVLKSGGHVGDILDIAAPAEPQVKRYIHMDATYESLGASLMHNPNGICAFRDELVSLLRTLDREEYAAARGFFLTAWNGTSGYTFDRIGRGHQHIEAACVSLLGSTQPGRFAEYINRAIRGGSGDDGLVQRFGLLVWPDQQSEWKEIDRYPDSAAREAAWETFTYLDELDPDRCGAERDTFEAIPFLRLDDAAGDLFRGWRQSLEDKLRHGGLHAALESHLAKYRKLVPALALLTHLADRETGPVSELAMLRAVTWAEYLETHARRAYSAGSVAETAAGKAILARLRKGDLTGPFTARDVHQRDWSNLTDRDQVQSGLDLLSDLDWLAAETQRTGGRPRTLYHVNPRGFV